MFQIFAHLLKYYESSIKIIIFKLILAGFKQSLGSRVQNFILRAQKKKNHIYKMARLGGSFEPPELKVMLPLS